ncbi:hypothetical protein [Bythopirellula polymerisocia]|uniref:Uncharacterized protein n=1 Tax=Bythopirellula polymerisocia TaxID=2528003 RepID=A0A5C6CZW2_9BACT|nr:hypothetical protein [Bythopirellula polymerisocia]TWU30140.1 hypothetical protein Pla144_09260 [Bythopirellula polymerisocia]
MSNFDPAKYGQAFADVISGAGLMPLDHGIANREVRPLLSALTAEKAFAHSSVSDAEMARCCLSGIWLLYNYLDESHTISQGINTPSGSYWHGIMHRREGDYSNAKYWMRRAGDHPVFSEMAANDQAAGWDPFLFVDECEQAVRGGRPEEVATLCAQQQLEWQFLFDFCYGRAVGN